MWRLTLPQILLSLRGTQIRKEVTMNILIVEDDPVIADVIGMTLEEAGHFSTIAHTIEASLAELRHNRIDAV